MDEKNHKLALDAISLVGVIILLVSGAIRQASLLVSALQLLHVDHSGAVVLDVIMRTCVLGFGVLACIRLFSGTVKKG